MQGNQYATVMALSTTHVGWCVKVIGKGLRGLLALLPKSRLSVYAR